MPLGKTLNWQESHISSDLKLADDEIHLWWVDLRISWAEAEKILPRLSEKQRLKVSRFYDESKKLSYIAGRGFLQRFIQAYTGEPAPLLEYNKYGKPSLANTNLALEFNYSDTLGRGVFCFSRNAELGVDLESLDRKGNFQRIIERRFSAKEQEFFRSVELSQSFTHHFLRCWTRKEAYGKAKGVGLNYTLRDCDLCTDETSSEFLYESDEVWRFQQIRYSQKDTDFLLCLVNSGKSQMKIITRRFDEQAS